VESRENIRTYDPPIGSRSERGTKVAAMMYSLVETAKINGVDPELYLKLGVQLHREGGGPQPRGGLIDSLIRPVHRSTSVGLFHRSATDSILLRWRSICPCSISERGNELVK
jgi:hypothetical protein